MLESALYFRKFILYKINLMPSITEYDASRLNEEIQDLEIDDVILEMKEDSENSQTSKLY